MNPLDRSRFLAALLVAAFLVPALALADDPNVRADQVSQHTDSQFVKLVADAKGDQTKVKAVELTQKLFNKAMLELPPGTSFALKDVNNVGDKVGGILDVVVRYDKVVAAANIVRQTDPVKADHMVQVAALDVQTQVHAFAASMPCVPPVTASAATTPTEKSKSLGWA